MSGPLGIWAMLVKGYSLSLMGVGAGVVVVHTHMWLLRTLILAWGLGRCLHPPCAWVWAAVYRGYGAYTAYTRYTEYTGSMVYGG